MPDIIVAVDEKAANVLLHDGESALGKRKASGGTGGGLISLTWNAEASLAGGMVGLTPPKTIAIEDCEVDYALGLDLVIDLSSLELCLPSVQFEIPCIGEICTPKLCFEPPPIPLSLSFSSALTVSLDLALEATLVSGNWEIDAVLLSVPTLDLGADATLLLEAIMAAIAVALDVIPGVGLFLSFVVGFIAAAFGVAEVEGLLGDVLTALLSGLRINLHKQPQHFEVIPSEGPADPAVFVNLLNLAAEVQDAGKPELVVSADIHA
jgi:hypothetical protein